MSILRMPAVLIRAAACCAVFSFIVLSGRAYGEQIIFGPENSNITGQISYTLIGKYNAGFDEYTGKITFDQETQSIRSVQLNINTETIHSGHPRLDSIVKSPQILDVEKFPQIIFSSSTIKKIDNGHQAEGRLTLHGVTKDVSFPFQMNITSSIDGRTVFTAEGEWVIPRKEYGIIWNKYLDKGGIIVGNHLTVSWTIKAPIQG